MMSSFLMPLTMTTSYAVFNGMVSILSAIPMMLIPHPPIVHGWPLMLRGGCGAELQKLLQWFLPFGGCFFLQRRDAEIGHLPGGFKCEFGGGNRSAEEELKHAETQIVRVERRKLC